METGGVSTRTFPYTVKPTWWLSNRNYFIFMLRELSPVFMALFLFTFVQIPVHLLRHPEDWTVCTDYFKRPGVIAFNIVALLFSLLHAITWFQAATTVLPVKLMGKPFPPKAPPPAAAMAGNIGMMVAIAAGIIVVLVKP